MHKHYREPTSDCEFGEYDRGFGKLDEHHLGNNLSRHVDTSMLLRCLFGDDRYSCKIKTGREMGVSEVFYKVIVNLETLFTWKHAYQLGNTTIKLELLLSLCKNYL